MRKAESEGAEALHAYLAAIDPESAALIHPNNVKRVARALEIYLVTGKTKSSLAREKTQQSRFKRCLIVLEASDRDALYSRINARVDAMMAAGLEEEARGLWKRGLTDTPTASQAIGYKELFPYFEGRESLETAVENIKQATRNYAKRQITYFRRMDDAFRIDCTNPETDVFAEALRRCRDFLEDGAGSGK